MDELVYFYPDGHQGHADAGHPERPERIEALVAGLREAGWWEAYPHLAPLTLDDALLHRVHAPEYLNLLQMACRRGGRLDMDTYVTPASWDLAHRAAGGAAIVAEEVWSGQAQRGFALTRPPGHHAMHGQGMGFCLINNVAVAAQYLVEAHSARRLAIVDLDLHHGNGTQDIFWRRGDVFYISTHQSPLYPGTGRLEETGAGEGEGLTANFPLPPGSGDRAFAAVMGELIIPLLDRFMPEMLLVSYGFDPHWSDPLGHLTLSASGYAGLVASLASWADQHCQGRICLCLEGGYDLEAGKACTQAVTACLLGIPWEDSLGKSPYQETSSWERLLPRARSLWGL